MNITYIREPAKCTEAWGYRHRRPYPSAELMLGKHCTPEQAVEQFRKLGYTGCVLS